jgi:hypothetical protein
VNPEVVLTNYLKAQSVPVFEKAKSTAFSMRNNLFYIGFKESLKTERLKRSAMGQMTGAIYCGAQSLNLRHSNANKSAQILCDA